MQKRGAHHGLASGSYIYTLPTSDGLKTRQMTLVR